MAGPAPRRRLSVAVLTIPDDCSLGIPVPLATAPRFTVGDEVPVGRMATFRAGGCGVRIPFGAAVEPWRRRTKHKVEWMHLSPHEQEKLLIYVAADIAAKRRLDPVEPVKLNYPEVVALISVHIMEGARRGKPVLDLAHEAARLFYPGELMEGVFEMVRDLQVEATFPDGSKLCSVRELVDPSLVPVPDPEADSASMAAGEQS